MLFSVFFSLGLLRAAVHMILEGKDSASVPMIGFIIVGGLTVIVYFVAQLWSLVPRIGVFMGSRLRVFLSIFGAVAFFIAPYAWFSNVSVNDWLIDGGIAVAFAVGVTLLVDFIFRREVESFTDQ